MEKESQLEVKRQALAAAAKYMDSVQKIDNNLKVAYKEVPYSKDIERPDTKINKNGYVPDAQAFYDLFIMARIASFIRL